MSTEKVCQNFADCLIEYLKTKYGAYNFYCYVVIYLILILFNPLFNKLEEVLEFLKKNEKAEKKKNFIDKFFKFKNSFLSLIILFLILSIINRNHFRKLNKDESYFLTRTDYFNYDMYYNCVISFSNNSLLYILNVIISFFTFIVSCSLWKHVINLHNSETSISVFKYFLPVLQWEGPWYIIIIKQIVMFIPLFICLSSFLIILLGTLGLSGIFHKHTVNSFNIIGDVSGKLFEKLTDYKYIYILLGFFVLDIVIIPIIFGTIVYIKGKKISRVPEEEKQSAEDKLELLKLLLMKISNIIRIIEVSLMLFYILDSTYWLGVVVFVILIISEFLYNLIEYIYKQKNNNNKVLEETETTNIAQKLAPTKTLL